MNYTRYICQFKKLIILTILSELFFSCAQKVVNLPTKEVPAVWFKGSKQKKFVDGEIKTVSHLFFDMNPDINLDTRELNSVILVEEDSDHHYELDLNSGRRVYTHSYCSENDVWKELSFSMKNPPFHYGFIPRLLNKQKRPQKVIIFGDKKYLTNSKGRIRDEAVRVRIVGGVIQQFCNSYPCDKLQTWEDTVILVAVAIDDPEFKKVNTILKLQKIVDWSSIKAFLENGRGRSVIAKNTYYPAYRVYGSSAPVRALKYVLESGHLFSIEEMNRLWRTCDAIYEKVIGLKKLVKEKNISFSKAFLEFYDQYWRSFNTCKKYVRSPDIKNSFKDHWFYEYLYAFTLAGELGYVYRCNFRAWEPNQINYKGEYLLKQKDLMRNCDEDELNDAFPKAVNLLSSLSKTGRRFFRYIEYDQGIEKYNEKIYNWVEDSGKRQLCSEINEDINSKAISIFPKDVEWIPIKSKQSKDETIIK